MPARVVGRVKCSLWYLGGHLGSFSGTFVVYITINWPFKSQSCWSSVLKNCFLVWEPLLMMLREIWPLGRDAKVMWWEGEMGKLSSNDGPPLLLLTEPQGTTLLNIRLFGRVKFLLWKLFFLLCEPKTHPFAQKKSCLLWTLPSSRGLPEIWLDSRVLPQKFV